MKRVLYDLAMAALPGHSGIPQDVRLLLRTLCDVADIEPTLFIHPRTVSPAVSSACRRDPEEAAALILNGSGSEPARLNVTRRLQRDFGLGPFGVRHHALLPLRNTDFFDAIWRVYLSKSLPSADRAAIQRLPATVSAISDTDMRRLPIARQAASVTVDTTGFDAIIFPECRNVDVSPGTRVFMRYHDTIPITAADTVPRNDRGPSSARRMLARIADSTATLVCNSAPTRDQLLNIEPRLAGRAVVVPYTLPEPELWRAAITPLSEIVLARSTLLSLAPTSSAVRRGVSEHLDIKTLDRKPFIVMVSTLEPRKNFEGAIKAFEILRQSGNPDLILVIVARPGWRVDETLAAMAPGVAVGRIIHLVDLSFDELLSVYRQAAAMVFPSYSEGFGFTALEAMQVGTPAVVSDIPTHRWVLDDAALYADPYEPQDIASKLRPLLDATVRLNLRQSLAAKARPVLNRYTRDATSRLWADLLASP